jgi:hypothetical protein
VEVQPQIAAGCIAFNGDIDVSLYSSVSLCGTAVHGLVRLLDREGSAMLTQADGRHASGSGAKPSEALLP